MAKVESGRGKYGVKRKVVVAYQKVFGVDPTKAQADLNTLYFYVHQKSMPENNGLCDICENPAARTDGTTILCKAHHDYCESHKLEHDDVIFWKKYR